MPTDDEPMSADEATAEKERLVGGPDLRAGMNALGSRLDRMRLAGLGMATAGVERGRSLGDCAVTSARSVSSKSVESLRTAGSAACASGSEKLSALKAAKDGAKERCGEAISAASAVSGVSLGGLGERMSRPREPPKTAIGRLCARCPALTYKQRLIGAVACMVLGWLLSLSSLLSFTRLLLGNPLPFAYKCARLCPASTRAHSWWCTQRRAHLSHSLSSPRFLGGRYTLGNLLSLGATSFIVGPAR